MFIRITDGKVFADNGKGSFVAGKRGAGARLEDATSASRTSRRIIHDPLVRKPFLRVFVWTFVFARRPCLLSFAIGLFLAIALDKTGLRFQGSTGRCSSSRTRSPASCRCSSGRAC